MVREGRREHEFYLLLLFYVNNFIQNCFNEETRMSIQQSFLQTCVSKTETIFSKNIFPDRTKFQDAHTVCWLPDLGHQCTINLIVCAGFKVPVQRHLGFSSSKMSRGSIEIPLRDTDEVNLFVFMSLLKQPLLYCSPWC